MKEGTGAWSGAVSTLFVSQNIECMRGTHQYIRPNGGGGP